MYGTFRRGELGPTVGPLEGYGNLFNLFSAAYDKGGKVFGLIEQRLGSEAASLDFFRRLWCRYHFRILRAADLQRELEEYTGRPWGDFFAEWVYGRDLADWSVEAVQTSPASGGVRATVTVKQRGKVFEPTSVGFSLDKQAGYAVRVPLVPVEGRFEITDPPGSVERLDADTWRVDVLLPEKPSQVAVDPDQIVPDSHPRNNFWHTPIAVRPSPVYTLVDETDLFNRYDACNVIYGPWLFGPSYADPWYTRSTMLGLRAGIQKTQELYAGAFTAYRTEIRDIVAGADFLLDHTPFPYTQVGGNFERRLVGPFGADGPNNVNRASLFGRWVFQYGPSFYLPPIHYLEGFGVYQDNYLPYTRTPTPGAERPLRTTAGGLHYHLNLLTPYWDAETGVQFDATYSAGVAELARSQGFQQFQSQLSGAQKLPDGLGWLSHVKLAGRVSGAVASPQQGQFFALGGGTIFRGFDLAERQGNAYWAASAEARLPVLIDVRYDICDRLIGLRNLYVAPFYDAGEIYANGDSVGGVAHAVGVGLRAEVVVFSIMERAVLRLDAAKTVNAATPVQFWIGFSHPF
jgi:hypothetical protein